MTFLSNMDEQTENPYGDLHIYYLEGRVQTESPFFGSNFIGNWQEDGHAFLFFSEPSLDIVERLIEKEGQLTFLDQFQMTYDEWHGGAIVPVTIGRINVLPPWGHLSRQAGRPQSVAACSRPGTFEVLLDPGVVFGTGFHPTTHACIEALEQVSALDTPARVLDIGTGTGILAIAAIKLGGQKALAVDLNLLAADTTRRNIRLNKMEGRILAVQGDAENFMDFPRDLMISNIHYDVMKRLIQCQGFLLSRYFILSGLLRSQAARIERMLDRCPVEIIKKWGAGGIWHTFLGHVP